MGEAVIGEQEAPVAGELLGAGLVGLQPAAGGEEGRRHVLGAEIVDDGAVIAGNRAHRLAKVEGERDGLVAGRQVDAADDAGQRPGDRRQRRGRGRLDEGVGRRRAAAQRLARHGRQLLGRPAGGKGGLAGDKRPGTCQQAGENGPPVDQDRTSVHMDSYGSLQVAVAMIL